MTPPLRKLRSLVSVSGGVAGASAFIAGCTFLISFDDVPSEDAGLDATTAQPDASAGDSTAPVDGDAAAADANLLGAASCSGLASGLYCGTNGLKDWPGDKDHLVTCDGGAVASVRYCEGGLGCLRMPNPYPDQCDECWRKADGVYCGRDMPGWEAKNADTRVRCQNGAEVGLLICTNGCQSNGSSSACK